MDAFVYISKKREGIFVLLKNATEIYKAMQKIKANTPHVTREFVR